MKFGTITTVTLTVHMIHPDGTYEAVEIGPGNGQNSNLRYLPSRLWICESDDEEDFAIVSWRLLLV